MGLEGTQLARAMLAIHELEMSREARHPGELLSERIERRVVYRQRGHRTLSRVGRLLVRAGLRLQEYKVPRQLSLGKTVTQR